jgi:DHA1 family multidrug resistance protein-like MFS transporter
MIANAFRLFRENRVLLVVCLVILVNQLGFGIIIPVTPIYARTFGVNEGAIGLVIAVYGLGRFLFSVPVGQAADRFGRKPVILAGAVCTCAGSVLCALAGDFTQLLLFRFVAGVGSTAVITGTQIVVADVATPANRGRMMSTYSGFFQFAVGLGPGVGGVIALLAGPRAPFWAFGVLALVAGAIAMLALPQTQSRQNSSTFDSPSIQTGAAVRLLLRSPGFLTVSLVTFVAAFNRTGAIFSVVPLMGVERLGLDTAQIGFALTVGNLLNLLVVGFVGILVDRYGRKVVIVPSCLFSAAAFVGFAYATGYPLFVASAVLWGVGVAGSGSASATYAADQAPPGANGITMGIYRMLSDLGYVIGPAILGVVAENAGAQAALSGSAILALVATLPFLLLAPETLHRRRPEPVTIQP